MARLGGTRLFLGQPQRMQARQLVLLHAFVDRGGNDMGGNDAGLRQQRQPARAFAGENQPFSGSDR